MDLMRIITSVVSLILFVAFRSLHNYFNNIKLFSIVLLLLDGNPRSNQCSRKDCGDPCEKSGFEGRCNSKGDCQTLRNVDLGCQPNYTEGEFDKSKDRFNK